MIQVKFEVKGNPCPKPRMTRSDKWRQPPRPRVQRYWDFSADVQESFLKETRGLIKFQKCSLGFIFYIAGSLNKMDISNCIKGIEDALLGYGFPDDTMQYVRGYDKAEVISLCETCKEKCRVISECPYSKTIISIREI